MTLTVPAQHSLKIKITLGTLAIFLLSLWSLSYYVTQLLRHDVAHVLGQQQFSTVSMVAAQLNDELVTRQTALEKVAAQITPATLADGTAAQAFLKQHPFFLNLFNHGVVILGADGRAVADMPSVAGRVGSDYADVDSVNTALRHGRASVSRPMLGKVLKTPVFNLASPIRDASGRVIGALFGVISLDKPNFLGKVTDIGYGHSGGYLLIAPQHGLFVTASDKSRIMQALPKPGLNRMHDHYMAGNEGFGIGTSSRGVEELTAAKAIPAADWILGLVLPTTEAFAPIAAMQQRVLLGTLLLSLLAGGLVWAMTWAMLRQQLAPILAATQTLNVMSANDAPTQPLRITQHNEIDNLIHSVNNLLTTLAQREQALKDSENRYRTLIEWSPEAIAVLRHGQFLYVNPTTIALLGATGAPELVGQSILERIHPDYRHIVLTRMQAQACDGKPMTMQEVQLLRLDGSVVDAEVHGTNILYDGAPAFHTTLRDITARKNAEGKLQTLAFYDPLTRLPNRRLLLDRLEQALAACTRHQRQGALLLVDLDDFKTLNDTRGHDKGDLLLQQVAQRLSECTGEGHTVAHLGGDEFVVMLEALSHDALKAATQAQLMGEKILATLDHTYALGCEQHHSTVSLGITLFGSVVQNMDEPLKQADLALHQAKTEGRNTLRFFDPQMQAVVSARAALENDLRAALALNQFVLYYQAQILGQQQLTGAEVLLRWQHPQRGMVPPAQFIGLAESTGLILPLGNWVLETACTQLALWATQPKMAGLNVAVNVSARQFQQTDFVEQVLGVLARTGANPARLKLELTESLLVTQVDDLIAKMGALKARGVGFSLDDFGTGFSSLAYLKRLPLDQLKIDQSFVRDILLDPNDAAIAKMVIGLADTLGLSVIAEGVETEAQRAFLATQGCNACQGYLFSRPLPLAEFEALADRY